MSNQTQTAFEPFNGSPEEIGATLWKREKARLDSLEKFNTEDLVFDGLAYRLGKLIHQGTLESSNGRTSSEFLDKTKLRLVDSRRRSETLWFYRNYKEVDVWRTSRVLKKRKQKIAFTSLTALKKAFIDENQPKVDKTDTKVSATPSTKVDEKPNVGTTQPKVEPTDTKVSDTKPTELKVQKVKLPQNSKEFAKYVFETTIKLGFDKDEVLEHIFNMFDEASSSKTGTNG
tara:strand:- start:119 stop:808 length:690 start_codon:yes stop_codon:yes gene_type:complete